MRPIVGLLILVVLVQIAAASIVASKLLGSFRGQQRAKLNCKKEGICLHYTGCCCRVMGDGVPKCLHQVGDVIATSCSKIMPLMLERTCASDGLTYPSPWDVGHASCTANKPLTIKYFGDCRADDITERPDEVYT